MIKSFKISNYKSIADLELELGRINVIIGENGAGKSNILEAITLCSAAFDRKLDTTYLDSRGIRVSTNPQFMRSAFLNDNVVKNIELTASDESSSFTTSLKHDNDEYSEWKDVILEENQQEFDEIFRVLEKRIEYLTSKIDGKAPDKLEDDSEFSADQVRIVTEKMISRYKTEGLKNFTIYSPEESSIRIFDQTSQGQPLGKNGSGLLRLIANIYNEGGEIEINELKTYLKLVSWFEDFKFSDTPFEKDAFLNIRDKYIDQELEYLDQRSSNEGFLYLLFYLTLFISDKTPKFFAIDNIDNALNPKLCIQLMKVLTELAKKHDKQVIFTTHNPAILDGLDLTDPEQKLLVVSRKRNGETKVTTVDEKPKSGMKLSESFMSGMLGGLPKNF